MAYYQGDYYRGRAAGDYYRGRAAGDPGFLGVLKTIGLGIGRIAGVIPPAVATAAGPTAAAAHAAMGGPGPKIPPLPSRSLPVMIGTGATAAAQAAGQLARRFPRTTAIATTAAGGMLIDALTGEVVRPRRRRMNVLNPRALRRSMSRVSGFAKFARRTISFTKTVKLKKRGRR